MLAPRINLIYAKSKNGVIGRDNTMPWYLPEDMIHFKNLTQGAPVIMGRKTWESLPPKFRPLPERLNIILTRSDEWHPEGAITVTSLQEALDKATGASEVWVIGGAQIYEIAVPAADFAYVTEIHETYEGDTFAPELAEDQWQEYESTEILESSTGLEYRFVIYKRIAPATEQETIPDPEL